MNIIATIINSVPEPLATALLTAMFTGIMVFFLQKRIEHSFAEKMEQFKVKLQQSLFEHQTKFERHHEKAVEALEGLYQRILVISDKYEETIYECTDFYKNNREFISSMNLRVLGLAGKNIDYLQSKTNDFSAYFDSNRLFLSASSIREIKSIHLRAEALVQLVPHYMDLLSSFDHTSLVYMRHLNAALETLDFYKSGIEDEWDFLSLFSAFVEEMNRQTEKLEYLYKSVADIQ